MIIPEVDYYKRLEKAIDICQSSEMTATQMKKLTTGQEASPTLEVDVVGKKKPNERRKYQCGGGHNGRQTCPAMGAECLKCGRLNHFARACRSKVQKKEKPKVHGIEQDSDSPEDESDMYVSVMESDTNEKDWKTTLKLNGHRTTFKLDTGAQCNVISKQTYDRISTRPLTKSKAKVVTFGGHKLKACGKTSIECEHKRKFTVLEFEVVKQEVTSVLRLAAKRCNWCKELTVSK